jgi:hypothetical protein
MKQSRLAAIQLGLLIVTCVALWGCGSKPPGPAVEGIVTLDGQPLANANVQLVPQGETMGQAGFGKTDQAGKFSIGPAGSKQRGAAPGEYKVVISKYVKPDGTDYVPKPDEDPMLGNYKELLPAAYSDPGRSVLTVNVPDGEAKNLELKLNSKQK